MITYRLNNETTANITVYAGNDSTSAVVDTFSSGVRFDTVRLPIVSENWIKGRVYDYPDGKQATGWIETRYLGEQLAAPTAVPPVDKPTFVRDCLHIEMDYVGDEIGVSANYLIAWALLETQLVNFGPLQTGSDAIGPFQISSADWDEFLTTLAQPPRIDAGDRFNPHLQIIGAAYLIRRDFKAFATQAPAPQPPDIGPTIPSYLNLFHTRLLGAKAAYAVFTAQSTGNLSQSMSALLTAPGTDHAVVAQLIANRKQYLHDDGGQPVTVGVFWERTEAALATALNDATRRLATEYPPVSIDATIPAPWLEIAQQEQQAWNGREETDPDRRVRVLEYFGATDHHPTQVEAWCGAFVAWCLQQAGGSAAGSVIRGAARAANWMNWGNASLNGVDLAKVPPGAVVVLSSTDKQRSGHVTLFLRAEGAAAFVGLGGNQGDTVRESSYPKSRIRDIRWLTTDDVGLTTDGAQEINSTAFPNATEDDLLTFARTLFGEARGQPVDDIKAVANVVVNRVLSSRYPDSFAAVCLQPSQFSCWNLKDVNRPKMLAQKPNSSPAFDLCLAIARAAIKRELPDTTGGATHFHDTSIAPPYWTEPPAQVTKTTPYFIFYKNVA